MKPRTYRRPNRAADLEARIDFLSTSEGGRSTPTASGYRPNHDFGLPDGLCNASHEYPHADLVYPGESVRALIYLRSPELQRGRLHPGFELKVQEGGRIVGFGTVVTVLN